MTKYTLLVDSKTYRFGNGIFPSFKLGPMFVLFVVGVTIGISFSLMYTQYEAISSNQYHQLHLERLSMIADEEMSHMHMHGYAPINENQTKHLPAIEDVHTHENQTIASKLYKDIRILCWILTTPKNHRTRAIHIKRTWGKRCNKLLFMSSTHDKSIDSIALNVTNDNPSRTWGKTKQAFNYIYKHHFNDADWFLKADDDTYVILENLRYFLYAYSTMDPIYFGYKMNRPDILSHGYFAGGAGYVLSKDALQRFSKAHKTPNIYKKCKLNSATGIEDLEMGKCMDELGVLAGDTRDEMKRGQFFLNTPESHLIPGKINPTNWYWKQKWYRSLEGLDCCSDNAITFHHIRPEQMYVMDYLIYHLRPYGVVSYPQPLPKKHNFTEISAQINDEKPESIFNQSNLPN